MSALPHFVSERISVRSSHSTDVACERIESIIRPKAGLGQSDIVLRTQELI